MKKKLLSVLLTAAVVSAMFTACGESKGDEGSSKDGEITLTYWDGWVDAKTEPTAAAVQKALDKWEKEHPDIKIKVDHTTSGDGSYKTKIKSALASDQAPDVFLMSKGSFAKPYADAGKLLEMDELLGSDGLKGLNDGVIETATYNDKICGIPFNMHVNGLFCNTEIFEKYNVELPTTYDELIEACKTFRKNGVTPIAMGNKELWQSIQFLEPIAIKEAGLDYCMKACNKEESFDSPEYIEAAKLFQEAVKAGSFSEGLAGLTFIEGAAEFSQGNAAMTSNGTWGLSSFEGEDIPVNGKVKMIKFPSITGAKGDDDVMQAGPYEHFSINAKTEHPKEAMEFTLFMSKEISDNSFEMGTGLPVWENDSLKNDSELFNQALAISKEAKNFMSGWDFYLDSDVSTEYMNLAASLIMDKISPEDFAKKLQEANAK